jgi:VanZ family protein
MLRKNIFSILVALLIMYLSLANAQTFEKVPTFNIPCADKIVHFLMYFGLMSVMILENRFSLKTIRQLFLAGIIPFAYGILMEILQGTLTTTRSADVFDALADGTGVLVSILLWLWIRPLIKISDRD